MRMLLLLAVSSPQSNDAETSMAQSDAELSAELGRGGTRTDPAMVEVQPGAGRSSDEDEATKGKKLSLPGTRKVRSTTPQEFSGAGSLGDEDQLGSETPETVVSMQTESSRKENSEAGKGSVRFQRTQRVCPPWDFELRH